MKKILALLLISLSSVTYAQNIQEPDYTAIGEYFALHMKKVEALCIDSWDKAEELEDSFMEEAMNDPEIKAMTTAKTIQVTLANSSASKSF